MPWIGKGRLETGVFAWCLCDWEWKGHVRSPGTRDVTSATSTSAARCRRTLHKHTTRPARRHTARARTARARTAGTRNASMGSASAHNESMQSASTKHGAPSRCRRRLCAQADTCIAPAHSAGGRGTHLVHDRHVARLPTPRQRAAARPPPTDAADGSEPNSPHAHSLFIGPAAINIHTSNGHRRADLHVVGARLMGKDDLVVDVTARHDFTR